MKLKKMNGVASFKNCNKYKMVWDKKSRSNYQYDLKQFLLPYLQNHIVYEEFPVYGTRMTVDIFDATTKVAYEMQGEAHFKYIPHFHGTVNNYLAQVKRDQQKENWCILNKIKYVEIYPTDFPLTKELFEKKFEIYL
jgi:hypothetical protein